MQTFTSILMDCRDDFETNTDQSNSSADYGPVLEGVGNCNALFLGKLPLPALHVFGH